MLIFLGLMLGCALFIHTRAYSSNDASRLATVESLVHRGTWIIDESPFATVDKIKVGEHFYSDKPPILSLAGAGVYALLHNAFDLTLQPWGCTPERTSTWCLAVLESREADWAYFSLTLTLIALPGALMLVLIYRLARRHGFGNAPSAGLVLALGFGTAIFPYSTVFTNHVPAAAATTLAVYLLLTADRPSRARAILVGFAAALAAAIDLSAGVFTLALLAYVAARNRSEMGAFVLGALAPIAIAVILNVQIVGNPLPPQMYAPGYLYAGSEFGASVAGNQRAADVARYVFDLFVGERGVLAFFPIVLWFVSAALRAAQSAAANARRLAQLTLAATLVYVLYFALSTDNFGGYAYSPRWLLNPVPVLALFGAIDPAIYRPRWKTAVFAGLAAISLVAGFFGALNPWSPALPPLRLAYTAPVPVSQPAVALSGYSSYYETPAEWRALIGANNVVPRRFDARRGWVIVDGPTWYLIGEATPIAPELAGPLGTGASGALALRADLTPQAAKWLGTFERSAAAFGEEMNLIGYRIDRAGDEVVVITAWQIAARPQPYAQRRVSIALTTAGNVVRHDEALAARYDSLHIGDMMIQLQRLSMADLSPGTYRLQIGVIDPETGERLKLPDAAEAAWLAEVEK